MKKTIMLLACIVLATSVHAGSITQDNLTVKAGKTSWSKQNGTYTTAAQGKKFIFVDVEISNKRTAAVYVSSHRFDLIDRDGQIFGSTYCAKNDLNSVELRKGTKTSGRLAFEVPYNATAKELIFEIGYKEELRIRL